MFIVKKSNVELYKINLIVLLRLLPKFFYKSYLTFPEMELVTSSKFLIPLTNILKKHTLFRLNYLNDITAIDYLNKVNRFNIKYILTSLNSNFRIILSVFSKEYQAVPSLTKNFPSANWMEREVWDLFGIFLKASRFKKNINWLWI